MSVVETLRIFNLEYLTWKLKDSRSLGLYDENSASYIWIIGHYINLV